MPTYSTHLRGTHYCFADLKEVLAKATPPRSGDVLAGIAAANARERVAAMTVLADVPLRRFLQEPVIPYEIDEVTRLILDRHDPAAFAPISDLTVGQFREWLLDYATTTESLQAAAPGLTPEMVAAISKLCRNQDLILIASKCRMVTRFRNTIGLGGRLAIRLQPNHPTDDPAGIAAAIVDGLLYGCGDACIGINPATDNVASVKSLLHMLDGFIREYQI
ncbi:MAG: ethanolamine ammonia-lyase, partial [Phycisphaerales bacterium]|nr:ethanolamine ammonia-lyase [Phycisphaerales bacterium]